MLGETSILLVASQISRCLMYACRLAAAVSSLGCRDMTVSSSAYGMRYVFGSVGTGMSCMQRLESEGESTELSGNSFL